MCRFVLLLLLLLLCVLVLELVSVCEVRLCPGVCEVRVRAAFACTLC